MLHCTLIGNITIAFSSYSAGQPVSYSAVQTHTLLKIHCTCSAMKFSAVRVRAVEEDCSYTLEKNIYIGVK